MLGKLKKIKDGLGKFIYPITVSEAVFVESDKTLKTKLTEVDSKLAKVSTGNGGTNDVVSRNVAVTEFDESPYVDTTNAINITMGTGESLRFVFTENTDIEFDVFMGGKSNNLPLIIGGDKTTALVVVLRSNQTIYDVVDQKGAGYLKTVKYTALTSDKLVSGNGDRLRLTKTSDGFEVKLKKSGTTNYIPYMNFTTSFLSQFESFNYGNGFGFVADRVSTTFGMPSPGFVAKNVKVYDSKNTINKKTIGNEEDIKQLKVNAKKHMYNNTPAPIYIPDFSKTNQPYHPSVLYFANGWNGYKYWMANTPYPIGVGPYRDRWESVHIYCSNDGVYWEVPKGSSNPIDDLTNGEIENQDFFSDPHLVFKDNKLEVFYRICHKNWSGTGNPQPNWILRKTTTDGKTWTARETLIDLENGNSPVGKMVRSHALYWDGTKYKMWYLYDRVEGNSGGYCDIGYSESTDGITWTARQKWIPDLYINPWHMDLLHVNGVYHLLVFTRVGQRLLYYKSTDGINFTFKKTILQANGDKESFYGTGLYRGSIVYTGSKWKVYFTGENGVHAKNGLMIGDSMEELEVVNGNYHLHKQVFDKGIEIINNGKISSTIQIADTGECFGFDYTTKEPYFQKADGIKVYFAR